MRYLILFTFFFSATFLLHFFLWRKIVLVSKLKEKTKYLVLKISLLISILSPSSLILFRKWPQTGFLTAILMTWVGILFISAVVLALLEIFKKIVSWTSPVDQRKRQFLFRGLNLGAVSLASGVVGLGLHDALSSPRVKVVKIPLKKWPAELDGFTVAQLSDIHIGSTIKRGYVENVVNLTNALKPDLILITGDIVDGTVDFLRDDAEPLRDLKALHGTFGCLGNHEYYSGVHQWIEHLQSMNIRIFRNESQVIKVGKNHFNLCGVDDWMAKRTIPEHGYDLDKALEGCDLNLPTILMAHQPKGVFEAINKGVDIQISGHTHGGQIWPFSILVSLVQPFVRGLHQIKDSFIYVNCGTGFWGPALRVGAESEITLFKIYRA